MVSVATIDFAAEFAAIQTRLETDRARRILPPVMKLWDGAWNFRARVSREISASFQILENETGIGTLVLPAGHYLSKWVTDTERSNKNIFITVDKDGMRWSGCLDEAELVLDDKGMRTLRITFKHDYEHLKHILAYCNPFLPPEIQFPRLFIMFGPSKWALKMTLLLNIMRLETSLWALPSDPLNIANWGTLDQSTWSQVVAPLKIEDDNSQFCVVHSRFKMMHDVGKRIVADAQLTWMPRRWLTGDPAPWAGANIRHGCLVWELVDNSGWDTGTSFGGSLFTGIVRAVTSILPDGLNQTVDTISDPTFPPEYSTPGFKGTNPKVPGIILRDTGHPGITSASFKWKPETDAGMVTGGHSAPGVNEIISAGIQMIGDLIAAALFVPPVGGAADAILKPLYTDTLLAFMKFGNSARVARLGWSHFHEGWAEGADRAYTLSALIALRTGMWRTREQTSHTVTVVDGFGNLRVGENGKGNAHIGTRLGTTIRDWGVPGKVYVDRISDLTLKWERGQTVRWNIVIGQRPDEDPVLKGIEMIQELASVSRELGVL